MKRGISFLLAFAVLFSLLGSQFSASAVVYNETLYEAENANGYGTSTNTNHSGYTGTGFVDGFDAAGDYLVFNINVSVSGDYSMIFRYANASGYYASAKVYFDDVYEATAVFPSMSTWDSWGKAEVGTYFTAGQHTVKLEYNNHAINIDNLVVEEKHESTRSFYLSNHQNMMAVWRAAKACSEDIAQAGPRLSELHISSNWPVNQIKDYSAFFVDATDNTKYTNGEQFDSEGYFDENGILRTNYLKYNGMYPNGLEFSRDYAVVPNMNVIVTRYQIANTSDEQKTVNVLDMLNPANPGTGNISATYSSGTNTISFDRSSISMPYMALGAFATPASFQVGNDADSNLGSSTCSPWYAFNANGTLPENITASANAVSGGLMASVTIPSGETGEVYFFIAIGDSASAIAETISLVTAHNGAYWFNETEDYYADWLANGTIPDFDDPQLALMYKRNLILIKNSIRPGTTTADGAHAATTNPYDYGYKVWTRDNSVTAIALDAAGFTQEGAQYWRWLAARQLTGEQSGQFNTCIDLWTNNRAEFIEPEHDTIGWFMYGVYRHCLETGSTVLRDELWTKLTASADYVCNNIDERGFGPEDFSIFEDMDNYGVYTYTQALYVAGLQSMAFMAREKGLDALADSYSGAASTIKTAINRDDTAASGLWYPAKSYYDKFIRWDDTVSRIKDASGLILFVTGVVDMESSRAQSTIEAYEADLISDEFGMARYAMDTYYSKDSYFSPSGDEAVEVSPSWPQFSSWNAICSSYLGNTTKAENIFDWQLHRTGAGYMITGECVSDVTEKPCVSTASEPTTAAAFILSALVWDNQLDMRLLPERSNAGCYRELEVNDGCAGDWVQYQYVPYYLDASDDADQSDLSIKKVYIANDSDNLYIRLDNESGTLPAFNNPAELFQVTAYFQDASGLSAALDSSAQGSSFNHSFSYMITRTSNSNTVDKYLASNGWAYSGTAVGAKVEWECDSGRIELSIPLSVLGITSIGTDTWLDTAITIGSPSGGDSDTFEIHYRLTGPQQPWLYGDFE